MRVHTGWGKNMRRHHQNTFLVSDELLTRITYPLWDYQRLFLGVSQEITYFLCPITQGDTINTSFCINATRYHTLWGKKRPGDIISTPFCMYLTGWHTICRRENTEMWWAHDYASSGQGHVHAVDRNIRRQNKHTRHASMQQDHIQSVGETWDK